MWAIVGFVAVFNDEWVVFGWTRALPGRFWAGDGCTDSGLLIAHGGIVIIQNLSAYAGGHRGGHQYRGELPMASGVLVWSIIIITIDVFIIYAVIVRARDEGCSETRPSIAAIAASSWQGGECRKLCV
ncbi:MAG: hypothetical protein H6527_06580 [Actinobacteria bacterium]|nr:hypothetical protein [Actinomycetota bacterium]